MNAQKPEAPAGHGDECVGALAQATRPEFFQFVDYVQVDALLPDQRHPLHARLLREVDVVAAAVEDTLHRLLSCDLLKHCDIGVDLGRVTREGMVVGDGPLEGATAGLVGEPLHVPGDETQPLSCAGLRGAWGDRPICTGHLCGRLRGGDGRTMDRPPPRRGPCALGDAACDEQEQSSKQRCTCAALHVARRPSALQRPHLPLQTVTIHAGPTMLMPCRLPRHAPFCKPGAALTWQPAGARSAATSMPPHVRLPHDPPLHGPRPLPSFARGAP